MQQSHSIIYTRRQQLDIKKWDACIRQADNGLLYAQSFYLDAMAKRWDALLLGDYEAVMPLTWNRKYGISYLYQPFSCASLGVFGQQLSPQLVNRFIEQLPGYFRFCDIYLNTGNFCASKNIYSRNNYTLSLRAPFADLKKNFSVNTDRNIRKAMKLGCKPMQPALKDVLALATQQMQQYARVKADEVERFTALYHQLLQEKSAQCLGVVNDQGMLLASAVFFQWQHRAYYILAGNHPQSKDTGASHLLMSAFIEAHAGSDLVLDFEGSDIAGIARFYAGFGAQLETYPGLRYNHLPALLKLFKK